MLIRIDRHWLYGLTLLAFFVGSVAQAAPAGIGRRLENMGSCWWPWLGQGVPLRHLQVLGHIGIEPSLSPCCFWFWFMGVTSWVISQERPCGFTSVGVGYACCTHRLKIAWAPNSCFFRKAQALWSFLAELLGVPTFSQDWDRGVGRRRRSWERLAGDSLGGVAHMDCRAGPAWG